MKIISVLIIILTIISICGCVPDPIILHGDIYGNVADVETSQPIEAAEITMAPASDSASTDSGGAFFMKNINPGNYEIRASRESYEDQTKMIEVKSATASEVNFNLNGVPVLVLSIDYLDFGLDHDVKSFTISNSGKGPLNYSIISNHNWIAVSPALGNVTSETDTITVTINRIGLTESKYQEEITVISLIGDVPEVKNIKVLANGVMDRDGHYYGAVTIGTQTWMAENLKSGEFTLFYPEREPEDDGIVQKFCYDNQPLNCDIHGGLYTWEEMMDFYPSDTGFIGITQGICPDGWHIPTKVEWTTLFEFLGGYKIQEDEYEVAGGALKDTGNIRDGTGYWLFPNTGATNTSEFTGLPTGNIDLFPQGGGVFDIQFSLQKSSEGNYWIAQTLDEYNDGEIHGLRSVLNAFASTAFISSYRSSRSAAAVRCVKNP